MADLNRSAEWGISFERGCVVLTSPALPVAAIPISHRIRFTPHQLEVMIRRIDRGIDGNRPGDSNISPGEFSH